MRLQFTENGVYSNVGEMRFCCFHQSICIHCLVVYASECTSGSRKVLYIDSSLQFIIKIKNKISNRNEKRQIVSARYAFLQHIFLLFVEFYRFICSQHIFKLFSRFFHLDFAFRHLLLVLLFIISYTMHCFSLCMRDGLHFHHILFKKYKKKSKQRMSKKNKNKIHYVFDEHKQIFSRFFLPFHMKKYTTQCDEHVFICLETRMTFYIQML